MFSSYRNQSNDLQCKSFYWILYNMNIDFALVKEQTFFHLYMMLEQKRIFKPQNSKAPCNEKEIFKYFSYIFFWRDVKNWTFYSCEKFEKVRDKPGQKFAFKRSVQQVSLITHLKLLSHHVETSQLICRTNWLTGSCIMVKIFQQFRCAV